MPDPVEFELASEALGPLPVVNHFLDRIGLTERLERHLPSDDRRLRLAPATVIGVVGRNLVVGHRPVYALGAWAALYQPAVLGLGPGDAAALNDDRVGRTLDRLFDADRARGGQATSAITYGHNKDHRPDLLSSWCSS